MSPNEKIFASVIADLSGPDGSEGYVVLGLFDNLSDAEQCCGEDDKYRAAAEFGWRCYFVVESSFSYGCIFAFSSINDGMNGCRLEFWGKEDKTRMIDVVFDAICNQQVYA